MSRFFNNPIAEGLRIKNRLDMLYLIDCVENCDKILAIKDDGGDNDGYLHLHNDYRQLDEEDVETYKELIKNL